MGAAAGATDFLHDSATTRAGSALLTEYVEVVSVVTVLTAGIDEVLERGTAN